MFDPVSQQFFKSVLFAALLFFFVSQGVEVLNQMTLVPLKHRKALAAMKNKFSLIRIYLAEDRLSYVGVYLVDWMVTPIILVLGLANSSTNYVSLYPIWVICLGALIMCIGESLRLWATYTLGKFFTFFVVVTKDHKLIKKGPYRFVRHPAYLGGLILTIGSGVITGLWFAPLIGVSLLCVAYAYRIRVEEEVLIRKFGNEYLKYSKETAMIIPHVL